MFSNLLFLAVVLLVATLAPSEAISAADMLVGMALYLAVIAFIVIQIRISRVKGQVAPLLFIVNVEIIGAIVLGWFVFNVQGILMLLPWADKIQTPRVLLALLQYFAGLVVFYWSVYTQLIKAPSSIHISRRQYIEEQLRFIAPFTVPFIIFSLFGDALIFLPDSLLAILNDGLMGTIISSAITIVMVVGLMIFFPPILTYAWQCEQLPEGPMKQRLEDLCQRINFKHAGILTWPIMRQSMTAAIIGTVPRFRYVMFTRSLLMRLTPESVEAVLIHEIGHNRRKHLIIYPFIIMGAMIIIGYLSYLVLPTIDTNLALRHSLDSTGPWDILRSIVPFATYVLVVTLYFRFVFGFFSRLFERQADLTVFDVGVPPENMIKALDEVGILSGHIHDHPSWHHYSIRQRMNFLERATHDPSLVAKHHRKVKVIVISYLIALALAILTLATASTSLDQLSTAFDHYLNDSLR